MRYVYYKKENWFVLDDVVNVFFSVAKRDRYCCKPFLKKSIQQRAAFSRMGFGPTSIRLIKYEHIYKNVYTHSFTLDGGPKVFRQPDGGPKVFRQPDGGIDSELYHTREDKKKNSPSILTSSQLIDICSKKQRCPSCGACTADEKEQIGLSRTLQLIDFQSIQSLANLFEDTCLSSLVQFLIQYAQLCRKEGKKARNAMTKKDRENIAASQGWKCKICKKMFQNGSLYEVDHVMPVHVGGRNHASNLQALCSGCHAKKTDTDQSYPIVPLVPTKRSYYPHEGVEK